MVLSHFRRIQQALARVNPWLDITISREFVHHFRGVFCSRVILNSKHCCINNDNNNCKNNNSNNNNDHGKDNNNSNNSTSGTNISKYEQSLQPKKIVYLYNLSHELQALRYARTFKTCLLPVDWSVLRILLWSMSYNIVFNGCTKPFRHGNFGRCSNRLHNKRYAD